MIAGIDPIRSSFRDARPAMRCGVRRFWPMTLCLPLLLLACGRSPAGGAPVTALATTVASAAVRTATAADSASAIDPLSAMPQGYAERFTRIATIDRADSDGAIRAIYVNLKALDAFQATGDLPEGTTIVMEVYRVQSAPDGGLQRDADGYLVPDRLTSVLVKLKLGEAATAERQALSPDVANGGWVYGSFDAESGRQLGFNQPLCHACHARAQPWDYLFARPQLERFAATGQPQHATCDRPGRQPCAVPERQP